MNLIGQIVGGVVRLAGDGATFKITIGRLLDAHDAGIMTAPQVVKALRDLRAGLDVTIPSAPAVVYLPPEKRAPRTRGRK